MTLWLEIPWLLIRLIYYYLEAAFRLLFPTPLKDIRGQVVVVTGAGSGIGRQLAYDLSEKDAKIAILDVNRAGAEETSRVITERGGTAKVYICDVTKPDVIKETANQIRRDLGEVDILINNAGIYNAKSFDELTEAAIRRVTEINMLSNFWTVKEFLPSMHERRKGHIVNICSMGSRIGAPYFVDYCATKAAAFNFLMALAEELRTTGKDYINLTAVCPIFVNTPMLGKHTHEDRFHNILEPKDVSQATIEGLLRNRLVVHVPGDMKLAEALYLLPRKVALALTDFTHMKYKPLNEE